MKKNIISVCIPTYKRPEMLEQGIASFLAQNFSKSELIIVNDAPDDLKTDKLVIKYQKKYPNIFYERNKKNLGYCKNFLKCILNAHGKYVFFLGDDDLIIGKDTLKKYFATFNKQKNVDFIYSNIIQFDTNLKASYAYDFFAKDRLYAHGEKALDNMWLKSAFIAGLALRNTNDIAKFYPKDNVLFPQVELVGKILLQKDSFAIADYSVGARAHSEQLGFYMMKNERIIDKEQHAYQELYFISDRMVDFAKKNKISIKANAPKNAVDKLLKTADNYVLMAEGTKVDKKTLIKSITSVMKNEKRVKHSLVFWLQLPAVLILPKQALILLKELYRFYLLHTRWNSQRILFSKETNTILKHIYA